MSLLRRLIPAALVTMTVVAVNAQLPQAEILSGGQWLPFASKTLDFWPGYTVNPANLELSKYGGWKARRHDQGTGFFRVEKINGRWWAIDPEGYLYIHKAVNSVSLEFNTADEIYTTFREHGFNGFGNWTWDNKPGLSNTSPNGSSVIGDSTVKNTIPMAYTPRITFIGNYRNNRLPAGTPRIELPVFDPGFVVKAAEYAQGFLPYVNDPHVFGYFSDNELPFRDALEGHLAVTNPLDPNYVTAINFLAGRGKNPSNWDQTDATAYTALVGERYYSVVSQAIRSVDPNHMYIGSRCHSAEKSNQAFMQNAGQYVDIMTLNHYHHWGDRRVNTNEMESWLGRPMMFTEFYVKSLEHGNTEGAGFNGRNQTARALFYQNFISTLAESGNLVGFHWFKYQEGSAGNNTGIVNSTGQPYTELLDSMKRMNTRLYDFIDYVDSRRPAPHAVLNPEADAFFEGASNRSDLPELKVGYAASSTASTFRQTYMRFNVSSLGNQIDSARIVLRTVQPGGSGIFQVEFVEDDSWGETSINSSNAPAGSTVILTYSDGRSDLEIDVTTLVRQEIQGDGKFSLRIIATGNFSSVPVYGSREHTNPVARPVLNVDDSSFPVTTAYWAVADGSWGDLANWSTDPTAGVPNPDAIPGSLFDVTFNTTPQNANQIVDLNGLNRFSKSITFRSTGSTFFRRDAVNAGTNHIGLGTGGLTMQSGSGPVTFGDTSQRIELRAQANLNLTNDSSSLLQFNSPVSTSVASSGTTTLTLNGSGSGGVEFNTTINNGSSTNALTALNINTSGGYTLLRNSSSNFSGGLTLNNGVLAGRASNSLGDGVFTINGGTFGSVVSSRSYPNNIAIGGDFTLGGVSVPLAGSSNSTFSGSVDLGDATRTITLGGNTNTFSGVISNGGLTVSASGGGGTLVLSGTNTYNGKTTISAGKLSIAAEAALGIAPGSFTADQLTLNGGTLQTTATLDIDDANRGINLGVSGGTFEVGTGTTTIAATNNIAGSGTLTKTGTGTLLLSGTKTYTGKTTINAGTLSIANEAALGTAPGSIAADQLTLNGGTLLTTATLDIDDASRGITLDASGGTFEVSTGTTTIAATNPIAGAGALTKSGTGTLTLSGANTYAGQTTISDGTVKLGNAAALGNASPVSFPISTTNGSSSATVAPNTPIVVGMQVTGSGIRTGTRVSGYTASSGAVTLNLEATATSTVSADFVASTALQTNGTLDLNGLTINENFSENAGTFINSNTVTPAVITSEMVQMNNPRFDGPGDITVNNIRQVTPIERRITKNGSGTLTLGGTAANNRSGLTVNAGTVLLNKPSGVDAVGRHALIINGGTVRLLNDGQIHNNLDVGASPAVSNGLHKINAGTFDMNGFSEGLGGLGISTGAEPGGTVSNGTGTLSTLTLLGLTNADPLLTTATFPGAISGNIALVKQGTNTQLLTGALSYTGSTAVTAGTLSITSGSLADASAVTIATGAVLNLNHTGTDIISSLTLGATTYTTGIFDSTNSGGLITGTGKILVGATPYDTWVMLHQPGFTNTLPGQDHDGDGLTNQQEFAFGLNPKSGSSVNPITIGVAPATGNFSYTRNANSGLTYKVWTSTNLGFWTEAIGATQTPVGAVDAFGTQSINVTTLGSTPVDGKLFVRVTAE